MSIIPFSISSRIKKVFGILCLIAGGIVIGYALAHTQTPLNIASSGHVIFDASPGFLKVQCVSGCDRILPDPQLTPGAVRISDAATVCKIKWGADRRHVTAKMKREVCSAYGIAPADCTGKNYEIDHLIPRELGGADDVKNLWPQPWPQARLKDRLENFLHQQVCGAGAAQVRGEGSLGNKLLPLDVAQGLFRTNWFAAYQHYFGGSNGIN